MTRKKLIGQNGFAYDAELISNLPTGEGYVMSEDNKTVYRTICSATKKNVAAFTTSDK
jgi:hypothetical protein